jgi:hypothetical protein
MWGTERHAVLELTDVESEKVDFIGSDIEWWLSEVGGVEEGV